MKKTCRKCGEEKEVTTDFFPHNSKSADGFDGRCKACWKLISAAKTRSKGHDNPAHEKIKVAAKKKGWESAASPKVEIVPEGVEVVPLARFADLPGGGVQFMMAEGSLIASIEAFKEKYGKAPQVVYTPARFYLEIPAEHQDKLEAQPKPVKSRKQIKRKGGMNVRK